MENNQAPKKKKRPANAPTGRRPVQKPVRKKKKRQSGRVGRIVYGVLVGGAALAIAFFIYAKVQGEISIPENAAGSLISPVQNAVSSATRWVKSWFSDLADVDKLRGDYEQLQIDYMQLQYQYTQLEEEARENDRLKALLDAQSRYEELNPIYARVIAKEAGRWFDLFSINRGTLSGVSKGMAVISADGLVGRVYEAGLNYAKVICIINGDSAVYPTDSLLVRMEESR